MPKPDPANLASSQIYLVREQQVVLEKRIVTLAEWQVSEESRSGEWDALTLDGVVFASRLHVRLIPSG